MKNIDLNTKDLIQIILFQTNHKARTKINHRVCGHYNILNWKRLA